MECCLFLSGDAQANKRQANSLRFWLLEGGHTGPFGAHVLHGRPVFRATALLSKVYTAGGRASESLPLLLWL